MNKPVFEIVGSSEIWWRMEELHGKCHRCSGDGILAETNRAACYPELYAYELLVCQSCDGTGMQRSVLRQT